MVEPDDILQNIEQFFLKKKPLVGKTAIVTSGPTFEPIDPVRFIGNRSSGKQGHAIAIALRDAGASVTLITGPVSIQQPSGMSVLSVETATQMMDAVEKSLPADIAVCAAAVADYGVIATPQKQKKSIGKMGLDIQFTENPDILKTISHHKKRPKIVIGFAAETENMLENAKSKLDKKGCDLIIANNVGDIKNPVFGNDKTSVTFISSDSQQIYENITKDEVAQNIVTAIASKFS
jgi:phosphopantothenoylcysteine decarboxylase/phosphopantothenate--cysteine ligase